MPVEPASFRAHCGYHEQHQGHAPAPHEQQAKINRLAASQTTKMPQTWGPLSVLLFSATVLTNLRYVAASPLVPRAAKPMDNHPGTQLSRQYDAAQLPTAIRRATPLSLPPKPLQSIPSAIRIPREVGTSPTVTPTVTSTTTGLQQDENTGMLIAQTDNDKTQLLDTARDFLDHQGELSPSQLDHLVREWRQASLDAPITLSSIEVNIAEDSAFIRDKRISMQDKAKHIADHITLNCAFEEDIYHSDGISQGKLLIFKAQRVENPFRLLYDNTPGYTPSDRAKNTSKLANFMINVMTLGIKPFLGNLIANNYRKRYYTVLGDDICATRQDHISFANVMTTLDVTAAKFNFKSVNPLLSSGMVPHSHELANSVPLTVKTSYISVNKNNNIRRGLKVLAKGIAEGKADVLLLPREDNDFDAIYPISDGKEFKRRVKYDNNEKQWYFLDSADNKPLNIGIEESNEFISIEGQEYALHKKGDHEYEIALTYNNGEKKRIPVYMHPLSKTWQLDIFNNEPYYNDAQLKLINQFHIDIQPNKRYSVADNSAPDHYGTGIVYEVRNQLDDIQTTSPHYLVVEMRDTLIPVKKRIRDKKTIGYMAYDLQSPAKNGFRIVWDGTRWDIEKATSRHISQALRQMITEDMLCASPNPTQLSAPDPQGIKWLKQQGYMKAKGKYIEILPDAIVHIGPANGKQIAVFYHNQQFHPLSQLELKAQEREQLIQEFSYILFKQEPKNISLIDIETAANATLHLRSEKQRPQNSKLQAVTVESIPSTALDQKRFRVTLSGHDDLFVETPLDSSTFWVLRGEDSDRALEKYQQSRNTAQYPNLVALKRNTEPVLIAADSLQQIEAITLKRIARGRKLISEALEQTKIRKPQGNTLLVAQADFLMTSAFVNNIFSSPKNTYQSLIDQFIPLSKQYPNAIIIPGSVYLSQHIPKGMRYKQLIYQQGEVTRELKNAVNFATVVVPVFHGGKLITLARKGEYMTYAKEGVNADEPVTRLKDLDHPIPREATLHVDNIKKNLFVSSSEWVDSRTGTLFAGKTLLPHEQHYADWFFCPCRDANGVEVSPDKFFSNEFIIDGNKFLLVIEDEFMQHGDKRPYVRTQAYPQHEQQSESNRYDWIVHTAVQERLDPVLCSAGDNYLFAARNTNSDFQSSINNRSLTRTTLTEEQMVIFQFDSSAPLDVG